VINQTNILFFFQAEIHYDPFEQECEEFRERIGEIKEAKNAVKSFINIGYLIETSKHLYELANRIPKEKR